MKKAFASLLVALLCCIFAVTAVGCSETQTAGLCGKERTICQRSYGRSGNGLPATDRD